MAVPGIGLAKGLGITLKHMFRRAATQQYPHVQPELAPRTRGVIALMDENCTVCMLCARECPDWCIYIDSHKESVPPAKEGGRARTRNMLDRFAIDFALCMYCGICVEVCPFDALWWSPKFDYSELRIEDMLHEMDTLRKWMDTVPPPPELDAGALPPDEVADALAKEEAAQVAAAAAAAAPAPEAAPTDTPAAPAAAKPTEAKVEAGAIDQETFDKLIAEGKSERVARAKAKAAYVRKQKAAASEGAAPAAEAPAADAPAAEAAPATPKPMSLADVEIDAPVEIDQETFDRLIAEGKSERVARSKAKAAWVKKQKQAKLDEGGA